MCGICGIWGESNIKAVEAMVKAMHHRGPDDRGVFSDETVTLGMSRLAIIDLSMEAHQPMCNPEQTIWIVYNGEVYNFKTERNILEEMGYRFKSQSDTEVVIRMYEHYGDDFLLRLRGMFAMAIYDRRAGSGNERMLLARDQVGIKPLLYTFASGHLIFGSEIKALLASGLIEPLIDPVGLRLLLTYGSVYQPRTILKGVQMLLPAHRMIVDRNGERIERYWTFGLNRHPELRNQPYEAMVDEVAKGLEESVRLQLVSDVPVGAFLSGGVDSSLVVGLMARTAGWRVKTFSIGYGVEGAHLDETDEAERTAKFLGSEHTRVLITGKDIRERIEDIAVSLDQPSVDGVNSYFVSMAARQAVTVAISGTGGDEIFAGYPWFIQMARTERAIAQEPWKAKWHHLLANLSSQPVFNSLIPTNRGEYIGRLRNRGDFVSRYALTYQIFGARGAAQLLSPDISIEAQSGRDMRRDLKANDELPYAPDVERTSVLCLRGYTNNQLLRDIDAVSMAHSLEVRVPFLDAPLFDLVFSLPSWTKLANADVKGDPNLLSYRESGAKKILVDAGHKLGLLREDIDQQPKRGFTMPFDPWMRKDLRDVLEDTLSERAVRQRGLFRWSEVARVKDDFINARSYWSFAWLLMMIELWCRSL